MTDLERAPSSIRDDSICESSLNKSSGDIVERLRSGPSASPDYGVHLRKYQALCDESSAEIERLGRELEQERATFARHEQTLRDNGIASHAEAVVRVHAAESALAAAWEEAARIARLVLINRAEYFERAKGHRDWTDAARSYKASAEEVATAIRNASQREG